MKTHTGESVRRALRQGPHDVIDLGHSQVAHWSFGQGPDVVFVHGWPLHAATFRDLVPALSRSFTCHLIDLPGAGFTTTSSNAQVGLAEHGHTVRQVVDALGLTRFAYVAHDSGACATRLAAAGDPRVAGLVMGNTEVPGHRPPLLVAYVWAGQIPWLMSLLWHSMRLRVVRHSAMGFGGAVTDPPFVDGEFGDLFVKPIFASPDVMKGQSLLAENLDFRVVDEMPAVHAKISAPVRLVWGEKDFWFPLEKAQRILDQFPGGADIRVIPRGRLYAHEDHPEDFLRHTEPFLRDCFQREAQNVALSPT
jgi:haloalkane dehalogenase